MKALSGPVQSVIHCKESPVFGPEHGKGREILHLRRVLGHRTALAPASSVMLDTAGLWSLVENPTLLLTSFPLDT